MASDEGPAPWAGPGGVWRRIDLGGSRVRWVEAGSGPPMMLLHGYGGTARWWARNLAALGEIRRVYALDLPGFGGSRAGGPFTLAGSAELLDNWMGAAGLEAADVVAHSMGGQLALLLAARYPLRVRSLLLAAPAGLPMGAGLAGIAWRAFRSRRGGDPRMLPLIAAGAALAGPRVLWQAVGQIRTVDVRSALQAIRAPTLIVWGERDHLLPAANGPLLAEAIPGARLHVVPGGGHNLMFDQPALFNRLVREFFCALPAPVER